MGGRSTDAGRSTGTRTCGTRGQRHQLRSMCKKGDTREQKERKPRNIQPKRREVVMHRSRLNAWVRTRRTDEQLFAALYSQGTTTVCLGKGRSGHCTNWEHAMRCRTWITWSMLTLGRSSRPPPTLTLCANSAHGRMSPTRTSRRTHRLHLPRLVKPNKSDVRLSVTKPDTCRTRVPKRQHEKSASECRPGS